MTPDIKQELEEIGKEFDVLCCDCDDRAVKGESRRKFLRLLEISHALQEENEVLREDNAGLIPANEAQGMMLTTQAKRIEELERELREAQGIIDPDRSEMNDEARP